MKNKTLLLGLLLVAVATALFTIGAQFLASPYTFNGSLIDPALPAPDLALTDQNGQPFRLSEQTGKLVFLFFGYTSCPDVCPTTLAQLKQVRTMLGDRADRVEFVFITVDPERDTPERLRSYLATFDPSFVGLTGTIDELEEAWQAYGVYRQKQPGTGSNYVVDHSARIYLVDARGNLRLSYPYDILPDELLEDALYLLREKSPEPTTHDDHHHGSAPEDLGSQPAVAVGDLRIEAAWARPRESGGTTGVFLTIVNTGHQPDALVSATSELAETVEIHSTQMDGDVMRMRAVDRIEIPAGERVELAPGGYHIMLVNLKRSIEPGEEIPLVLRFERNGEIVVQVPVGSS
jgi:protein SCO1/2